MTGLAVAALTIALALPPATARFAPRVHRIAVRRAGLVKAWLSCLALVPKFKLIIAFSQTAKLMPLVYGLRLPEYYFDWMRIFNVFEVDWSGFIYPGACLGRGFYDQLLLRAIGPLAFMVAVMLLGVAIRAASHVRDRLLCGKRAREKARESRKARGESWQQESRLLCRESILNTLPALLFIAFCLTPITSTSIFAAWTCETFQLDSTREPPTTVRFLQGDLVLKCDGSDADYNRVVALAYAFVIICAPPFLLYIPSVCPYHSALRSHGCMYAHDVSPSSSRCLPTHLM